MKFRIKIYRRVIVYKIRLKKLLSWQFNNDPFISGDSIADMLDVTFFPNRWRLRSRIGRVSETTRVVFTQSEMLEKTLEGIVNYNIKIVVAGNSDRDFETEPPYIPETIHKIYVQNLDFKSEKFEVIPIGLENFRLGKNGNPRLFKNEIPWELRERRILIGPFSNTHEERNQLSIFKYLDGPWDHFDGFVNEKLYRRLAMKYQFIACPRGNGRDTHRFWEALYSGAYPVVKESVWSEKVAELEVPFFTIKSWTADELIRISEMPISPFNPKEISALWTPYWRKRFYSFT